MRKLKLFTVAFVLGMTSLFASEKMNNANIEIRDQIVNLLNDTKFETQEDFRIEFTFTFNSSGEIVVLNVDSNRIDVKEYIRNNVNNKKIENPGIPNNIYKMPINVKIDS